MANAEGDYCVGCSPGKYQAQPGFLGEQCVWCPPLTFQDEESGAECKGCMAELSRTSEWSTACMVMQSCSQLTLLPFEITPLPLDQAKNTICNETDPLDLCDAPEYCMDTAGQCSNEPNRSRLELQPPCPSLLRPDTGSMQVATWKGSCWSQWHVHGPPAGELLFSADTSRLTVALDVSTSCSTRVVQPRFQYFFLLCHGDREACVETDALLCPAVADLSKKWWEGTHGKGKLAETIYESPITTESCARIGSDDIYNTKEGG